MVTTTMLYISMILMIRSRSPTRKGYVNRIISLRPGGDDNKEIVEITQHRKQYTANFQTKNL